MRFNLKHQFKRILIKCKVWFFLRPVYENLKHLSPNYKKRRKIYQKKWRDFYSQFIKPGDLCFDVGANEGKRTEIFLKLGAKVIAVEPQPLCIKNLERVFGQEPNFKLVKQGLSDKKGELEMFICEEADTISTFSKEYKVKGRFSHYNWNKKIKVPVTTLDAIIKEFGSPVFCKIDVEGFEDQVLMGLSQPIRYLSFEFLKEFPEKTKKCLDHLELLGYRYFNADFFEKGELYFQYWMNGEKLLQKISESKNKLLGGDIYAKL